MENNSIAIFPASGGIGGGTYRHLFNLIDAKKMILVARSPERVPEKYRAAGAVVRHGDYDQLSTLDHAFDGARYLNLISYASISHRHRFNVSSKTRLERNRLKIRNQRSKRRQSTRPSSPA